MPPPDIFYCKDAEVLAVFVFEYIDVRMSRSMETG